MDEVAVASRFALGTIFVLSGLSKAANYGEFERALADYRILPPAVSRVFASSIPPVELTAGAFLLVGLATKVTAVAVAVLLLVFSVAVAINLVQGRRIRCGCFGTLDQREISWLAVVRNLGLLGLAALVAWRAQPVLAVDGYFQSPSDQQVLADGVALLIAGSLGALLLSIGEEAMNLRRLRKLFDAHQASVG